MNTLTTEQVKKRLESNENVLLINTLDPESFEKTRIPDSINIPQSEQNFVERVEQQAGTKDRDVILYCASESCNSSSQAAGKLEQAGFTSVYDYEAGAEGWKQAGQELVAS
jgi:rhodanese-related sulfurtransferase